MKKIFDVTVNRICTEMFEIPADNLEQAIDKAETEAMNYDWASCQPEYNIAGGKTETAENLIRNIDWKMLRQQKSTLLQTIFNEKKVKGNEADDLTGILHLLDAIQDHAVDVLGIDELAVFGETKDEVVPVKKTKCVMICSHCGSDNVQLQSWVKPNENNQFVDYTPEEVGWCNDCNLHSQIDSCEIKTSAKVVGFQVVGEDGTKEEGLLHPDMDASFCLYNLTQAHEMLDKGTDGQWRLLTIWNGDIEESTKMFKGDPRK